MTEEACFAADGDSYQPLSQARSYWSKTALSGRAVVGLLGHEAERRHGEAEWVPARLTVDMFRLAPFEKLQIKTRIIKEGRRLRLIEADLVFAGEAAARATCQFLRTMPAPPGRVWSPAPWGAPHPDTIATRAESVRPRAFEMRTIKGALGALEEKQCWVREKSGIVEGRPFSPFSRVAIAADYVSPYAHAGDAGIQYMNTDVTLHLHRLPEGEWIGFESSGHEASQGIAVGHCRLHDLSGPIGFVSCTALANERRKP